MKNNLILLVIFVLLCIMSLPKAGIFLLGLLTGVLIKNVYIKIIFDKLKKREIKC